MIISSGMRCGTNWLMACLTAMCRRAVPRKAISRHYRDLAARIEDAGVAIIYGHMPLGLLAPFAKQHKIVCLTRDLRDAVVSLAWRRRGKEGKKDEFEERLLQLWRLGGDPHQRAWWESYAKEHERVPHLRIRYEDMLLRPQEKMLEVWDYSGLEDASGQPRPDDDFMAALLERAKDGVSPSHPRRRGIIGEWREHFTSEEGAAFYDKYMVATSHLGYLRE